MNILKALLAPGSWGRKSKPKPTHTMDPNQNAGSPAKPELEEEEKKNPPISVAEEETPDTQEEKPKVNPVGTPVKLGQTVTFVDEAARNYAAIITGGNDRATHLTVFRPGMPVPVCKKGVPNAEYSSPGNEHWVYSH